VHFAEEDDINLVHRDIGVDGDAMEGIGSSEVSREEDGTAMETAGAADDDNLDEDGEPMTMQKRLLKLAGHDPVCNKITITINHFFFDKIIQTEISTAK